MMNREQKILVIVTDYPDKVGNVKLQYIHTRNVAYLKFGLTVTVLNFAAKEDYFVVKYILKSMNINNQYLLKHG